MTKKNVVETMGLYSFHFVEIVNGKSYKYTNSDTIFKCFPKWKPFLKELDGREYAVMLMKTTVSETAKSGFSYDPVGIFALVADYEELKAANDNYLNAITFKATHYDKLEATLSFADKFVEAYHQIDRVDCYKQETYDALLRIVTTFRNQADFQAQKLATKNTIRGFTF